MSISGLLIISVLTWYFGIYKSIDSNQGDNSNEMLVGDQSPDIHGKNIDDQLINSTKDAFYTSENSNSSRNSVSRMAQESQNTSNPDFQLHETSVGNPLTKNQQVSTDYYNQYLPNFRFSTIIHVFDEELISDKISDNLGDEKQTNEIFYVDENQDKHIPLSIPSLKSTPFIDLHSIRGEKEITILPARNRWFNLLIYSGIGKTWIKYTNQNDAKLLQKMNQAEVGKEYLNIGLSTEKKIAQRWYINVGLRFGRLVSVIHNTSSIVNPVISQDITEIIIDSLGIERLIYGQKSGYQIMTTTSTWFTYHYQLELPVTVKYSFYSNPRYRVAVLGGFTLPIWMNSTGSYYDVEGIWKK
ncbi:MAG: hypothetical protein KDC04_08920, partial [Saprospiraceae bacterium]|nr:hypothetical protein [Saprospiraceae bacterium]